MKALKQVPIILLIFLAGCTVAQTPIHGQLPTLVLTTDTATPSAILKAPTLTPTLSAPI